MSLKNLNDNKKRTINRYILNMRKIILVLIVCLCHLICFGQYTFINGKWSSGTTECGRLKDFEIRDDGVVVTIEIMTFKALKRLNIYSSYNTYIITGDPKKNTDIKLLKLSGLLLNGNLEDPTKNWGWDKVGYGETRSYQLYFKGNLPSGVTNIGVYDYGTYIYGEGNKNGYRFWNYTINNPRKNYFNYQSEYEVKQHIEQNNDGICGIYEPMDDSGAVIACVKSENEYYLIYLSSPANYPGRSLWQIGDVKAKLRNTPSGLMKAEWYISDKSTCTMYVVFDGISMVATNTKSEEVKYLKTYPTRNTNISGGATKKQGSGWTGTGFALKNGYIVTNHHVVDGAMSIVVQGVNGSSIEYKAEIVSVDKNNDLALIRINDYRFDGFGVIPYSLNETLCDVGSDVFVLGYPLTSYMGEEIKLTNGIISSRSGYQGDVTTYQISAPIQPGNSGGPMFDKNGNVVGVVNAGIPGAENVGYAIKASYLCNLINSTVSNAIIPKNNTLSSKSLPEKVKILRNYTFYIKCK